MVWFDFLFIFQNKYAEKQNESSDPFQNAMKIETKNFKDKIGADALSELLKTYCHKGSVLKIEFSKGNDLVFSTVSQDQYYLTVVSTQNLEGKKFSEPKIQTWKKSDLQLKLINVNNPSTNLFFYSKEETPIFGELGNLSRMALASNIELPKLQTTNQDNTRTELSKGAKQAFENNFIINKYNDEKLTYAKDLELEFSKLHNISKTIGSELERLDPNQSFVLGGEANALQKDILSLEYGIGQLLSRREELIKNKEISQQNLSAFDKMISDNLKALRQLNYAFFDLAVGKNSDNLEQFINSELKKGTIDKTFLKDYSVWKVNSLKQICEKQFELERNHVPGQRENFDNHKYVLKILEDDFNEVQANIIKSQDTKQLLENLSKASEITSNFNTVIQGISDKEIDVTIKIPTFFSPGLSAITTSYNLITKGKLNSNIEINMKESERKKIKSILQTTYDISSTIYSAGRVVDISMATDFLLGISEGAAIKRQGGSTEEALSTLAMYSLSSISPLLGKLPGKALKTTVQTATVGGVLVGAMYGTYSQMKSADLKNQYGFTDEAFLDKLNLTSILVGMKNLKKGHEIQTEKHISLEKSVKEANLQGHRFGDEILSNQKSKSEWKAGKTKREVKLQLTKTEEPKNIEFKAGEERVRPSLNKEIKELNAVHDPGLTQREMGKAKDFTSSVEREHKEEINSAINLFSTKNISNYVFNNIITGLEKIYKQNKELGLELSKQISQMNEKDLYFIEKIKGNYELITITEHLNKIFELSLSPKLHEDVLDIISVCKTSQDKATVIQNLSHIGQREGAVTMLEIGGQALAVMIANKYNQSVKSIRPYLEKTNESLSYLLHIGKEGEIDDILTTVNGIEGKMRDLDKELVNILKYSIGGEYSKYITINELKSGINTILIGADAKNMWITNQLGMQLGDIKLNLYHKYLKEAGAGLDIVQKSELNAGADEAVIIITVKGEVPFEKLKSITEQVENESKQLLSKAINELEIDNIFKKYLLDGISSESVIGKLKLEETGTGKGRLKFSELSEKNGKIIEIESNLEHALNNSEMKHLYENVPKETRKTLMPWLNYKLDESLDKYLIQNSKGKSDESYTFVLRAEVNENMGKAIGEVCTIAEKRGILASEMAEKGAVVSASELNTFAGHVSLNGIRDTFTAYCNKLAREKYSEQIKKLGYETIEFHSDGPLVYYFVGKKNGKDSRIKIEEVEALGILDDAKALTIHHFEEKGLGVTNLKVFKDSGDSNKYVLEKAIGKENVNDLFNVFKNEQNIKHAKEMANNPTNEKEVDKIIFDHSMNRIETGMAISRIAIMAKEEKPSLFKEVINEFNQKEVDFLTKTLIKENGENNKMVRISSEMIYLIFNDKNFTKEEALLFLRKIENVDNLKNRIGQELYIDKGALK